MKTEIVPNHGPNPKAPSTSIPFTRRRFLSTALQAGALCLAPQIVPGAVLGKGGTAPSERIVLGAIGIGNRGSYVLGCFLEEPDVQFVAICDVKAARRKAVKERADAKYGNNNCATYRDLRELLARQDIDAVLIATGPNWHALASITAANAGKDVYCEKPCTKNIVESLALAETFRRTGRVFQAGTQRRSLPNFAFAIDLARRGQTGQTPNPARASWRTSSEDQRLGGGAAGPRQRSSTGISISARQPGGRSTRRCSMVSILRKAAAWSAAAASNGVRIAWTFANGPTTPTTRRRWSIGRRARNC